MAESISDLLGQQGSGPGAHRTKEAARHFGLMVGIVTNNKDPDKMGRCKVAIPDLSESESQQFETTWARLSTPMGGKERGIYFLPEVDDEVMVAFVLGDIAFPVIIGACHNHQDIPPETNNRCAEFAEDNAKGSGQIVKFKSPDNSPYETKPKDFNTDGKNDLRFFRSRSGHLVMFDDKEGDERITISDHTHMHRFQIRTKPKKIVFTSEDGDIEMYAPKGTIYLEAKNIEMISEKAMKLESKDTFDSFSKGKMKWETKATSDWISQKKQKHDCKNSYDRKASASMKVESGSNMNLKAGAGMTAKAGIINLN